MINPASNPEYYLYSALNVLRRWRQQHYWTKLMNSRLSALGGGELKSDQINAVEDLFGSYGNCPLVFHKFYTKATGEFNVRYMPDSLYYKYIDPYYNDWDRALYLDNKAYYRSMFPGAKQPRLITYRLNGFWYDENGVMIDADKAIGLILETTQCFIKQAADSEGGHGIAFIDNKKCDRSSLMNILDSFKTDFVVQEGLCQSKTLSAINESSVNTVRLLTLLKTDGTVKIYSAILRMGVNGAKVDNASSGGITVGICDDGRLKEKAFSAAGVQFYEHPTSKVHFNNFVIPNYDKVRSLVKEQAKNFPHFRLLSWDIAIDENDEPVIIEANMKFGEIDFHQLNNGPLFGDDTEEILKEVFGYRK